MKRIILTIIFIIAALPLFSAVFPVEFIPINGNILIHRSYELYNGTKTPSNGLIIISTNSVVLIDTAWNDEETNQIISYINKNIRKQIVACIITHSHQDRAGGLSMIIKNNIPLYMSEKTYKLLSGVNDAFQYVDINNGNIRINTIDFDIRYLGPAHSPDNITVYIPDCKLLFGGCIIKSIDSKTIGNTVDADLGNWRSVILLLKMMYPDVMMVIPGHGESGNSNLLDHTLELITKEID